MIIENKVASDNFKAYERENNKGHAQYVVNAKRQKAFYVGDQWERLTLIGWTRLVDLLLRRI